MKPHSPVSSALRLLLAAGLLAANLFVWGGALAADAPADACASADVSSCLDQVSASLAARGQEAAAPAKPQRSRAHERAVASSSHPQLSLDKSLGSEADHQE